MDDFSSESHIHTHEKYNLFSAFEKLNDKEFDRKEFENIDWRMKERLKTVSVALLICLNIGVDPPDVVKTTPCAKLEAWCDPFSGATTKSLENIGRNLQRQYEIWQPRAR